MSMLESRRRLIGRFGREMRLRRPVAGGPAQNVVVKGTATRYAPGDIEGAIQQGDERVELLADEVAAAGWSGVNKGDWLTKDGKQWTVEGSNPIYEGARLIGYSLWIRG